MQEGQLAKRVNQEQAEETKNEGEQATTAKTKSGERARELLPKYEAAIQRIEELKGITTRLMEQTRNLETNKEYKVAADLIEKDKDYQNNKDDLPELTTRVADLRRKVQ